MTEEQMEAADIDPFWRDFCASDLLEFKKCKREHFPWVIACKPYKHQWEQCEAEEYVSSVCVAYYLATCGLLLLMFCGLWVCLLVTTMSCAKTDEVVEMPFICELEFGEPKEPCIIWGPEPPGKAQFWEHLRAHCKVQGISGMQSILLDGSSTKKFV